MPKLKFKLPAIESENLALVCGPVDANLNQIEESLEVKISSRGNSFSISGEKNNVVKSKTIIEDLAILAESRDSVSADEVHFSIRRALNGATKDHNGQIFELAKGKDQTIQTPKLYVSPRNNSQEEFLSSIYEKDIAFGIGPAGTGKTYLAVAAAVNHFMEEKVNKIILTRPAVEAGESLGFLPGDLSQKVDPYLRPLYDALYEMMGKEKVDRLVENGKIEVAPLAYMRGRTLNDAFLILDEAQNCTPSQMKMFLTRIGFGSTAVVTGDVTQTDLPKGVVSGLSDAIKVLEKEKGISFFYFHPKDVVRHGLVQKIIEAYEKKSF
ncbi:MAG: PhoH family protein [Gammaproteobacteria bacterium]|tara:strand:+ start:200 stop:1171 length:972 start_codon:yes stop_codon:yes gene_type:complete